MGDVTPDLESEMSGDSNKEGTNTHETESEFPSSVRDVNHKDRRNPEIKCRKSLISRK